MLQVRKVIEHVYEKIMGAGSDAGSQTASQSGGSGGQEKGEPEKDEERTSIAEEKVELLCQDQVCYLLSTWLWKSSLYDLNKHAMSNIEIH